MPDMSAHITTRHMDGPPLAAPWRRLDVRAWRKADGSIGYRVWSRMMNTGSAAEVCEVLEAVSGAIFTATVEGRLVHRPTGGSA